MARDPSSGKNGASAARDPRTRKKPEAAARPDPEIDPGTGLPYNLDFGWFTPIREFERKNNLRSLRSLEDMRIYLLDQYLKQTMDGLKRHPNILQFWNGSPLRALLFFCRELSGSSFFIAPKQGMLASQPNFYVLVAQRLEDDLNLVEEFRSNGPFRERAATRLRQRGLLTNSHG